MKWVSWAVVVLTLLLILSSQEALAACNNNYVCEDGETNQFPACPDCTNAYCGNGYCDTGLGEDVCGSSSHCSSDCGLCPGDYCTASYQCPSGYSCCGFVCTTTNAEQTCGTNYYQTCTGSGWSTCEFDCRNPDVVCNTPPLCQYKTTASCTITGCVYASSPAGSLCDSTTYVCDGQGSCNLPRCASPYFCRSSNPGNATSNTNWCDSMTCYSAIPA